MLLTSVIDITDYLIICDYDFIQISLENIFSQVHHKGRITLSIFTLRALKIINIS